MRPDSSMVGNDCDSVKQLLVFNLIGVSKNLKLTLLDSKIDIVLDENALIDAHPQFPSPREPDLFFVGHEDYIHKNRCQHWELRRDKSHRWRQDVIRFVDNFSLKMFIIIKSKKKDHGPIFISLLNRKIK